MTDSKKSDQAPIVTERGKRERLTAAAVKMLHEQGVEKTTLADIARAADVPVGNVYYYFKTKDDLVEAALGAHAQGLQTMIASFEGLSTPQDRLKTLIGGWVGQRDLAARFGCPTGSLCSELGKRADGLDRTAAKVMQGMIDWSEQQFRLMGRSDSRDLAVALIAAYQGISLLANTFRDPELMVREGDRLERWIDSLGRPSEDPGDPA
ncbi:TetR/AcrR family transcriptional regulator [Streptosporangium subroseum]|uniref:TetR/AcrR family transcriptional regulator n=1 Tax=Streptosporangium subroseum TaxID=106412 RepID=UPI0030857A18|nr:TetR/AcrR family transcriptional regulator [Streptosporangium subroseum]